MAIDRERNENTRLLIETLRATIYIELNKPVSERDPDLIDECVDYLMELENYADLTATQISTAKESFMQSVKNKYPEKNEAKAKKFSLKPLLIAACVIISLFIATISTAALVSDIDSIVLQFIRDKITELRGGEAVEYMGSEIIKYPEAPEEQILSLEEFLNQNHSVLYPAELSSDIHVTEVICGKLFDSKNKCYTEYDEIIYVTSDINAVSVNAVNDPGLKENILSNSTLKSEIVNGFDCYISIEPGVAQANIIHNGYIYTINTTNYEGIIEIINGLKEN